MLDGRRNEARIRISLIDYSRSLEGEAKRTSGWFRVVGIGVATEWSTIPTIPNVLTLLTAPILEPNLFRTKNKNKKTYIN